MNLWRDFVVCPYNKNHVIRNYNMQNHIPVCKEQHQNSFFLTCRFSCPSLCQEDPEFLCKVIPDKIGSKSKRRRHRIRERHIHRDRRPHSNEPPTNSGLNEESVKMDNKQELWDVEGEQGAWADLTDAWVESVKKKSPKKNPAQASNGNAEFSLRAVGHRSKTARKRHQKKLRKEKGTGDSDPDDKSNKKKEYVIKLNESVSVTETNKGPKEVFIHYPTRSLLPPDSVPKGGLGIQPMMLQRICYEAFMKMQNSSDGDGNGVYLSAYGSETNQFLNEATNGDTSTVNEDENKITQGFSEITSAFTLSGITREIRTQASDSQLNADLYCPKRYKSKRDKKKWQANQRASGRNTAKPSSFALFSVRDRYAKYMISDNDELPPPRPRPNKYSFPPPYLDFEDAEVKKHIGAVENTAELVDYDLYQYFCDDEWPDEKDPPSVEENENANAIY